jgi:hypothetical protein
MGIFFDREIDRQHWPVPGFDNRPILGLSSDLLRQVMRAICTVPMVRLR